LTDSPKDKPKINSGKNRTSEKIEVILAFVAFVFFLLAVVYFFIDGGLIFSIGFFLLGFTIIMIMKMWDISDWAVNVSQRLVDKQSFNDLSDASAGKSSQSEDHNSEENHG